MVASFLPTECSGGRGMWGIFEKPLKRAIWNTLSLHSVLTTCFQPFWTMPVLLAASFFCKQAATMSAYKFTPWAVASPDAPPKPMVCKRARSGGAEWVQVTRHRPGSRAKKPCTGGLQQPACTHQEHHIQPAASFASQFWDYKVHPLKASQQDFLATCIDVDLERNIKNAQWHKHTRKRRHQTTYFVP